MSWIARRTRYSTYISTPMTRCYNVNSSSCRDYFSFNKFEFSYWSWVRCWDWLNSWCSFCLSNCSKCGENVGVGSYEVDAFRSTSALLANSHLTLSNSFSTRRNSSPANVRSSPATLNSSFINPFYANLLSSICSLSSSSASLPANSHRNSSISCYL